MELKINLTSAPKQKYTDESKLGFGAIMTDHMFTMDYEEGIGWHNHQIEPYAPFSFDPACVVLHYGQEVFEGLKAYRSEDNKIHLFRQRDNFERLNRSAARMGMPAVDIDQTLEYLYKLLDIEREWIPKSKGTSLYIRPTMIGTEETLGVKASKKYKFFIILSPSGLYYKNGLEPVPIYVEHEYTRACPGGTGEAKTGGNYAASILASEKANEKGYSQVLWLDGAQRKYVEEVGAMNIFFVIDGVLVTPKLNGSILPGITRDSIIKLAKSMDIEVEERQVSIEEIILANDKHSLMECFGTGTAAIVSPVGELYYKGDKMIINNGNMGSITQRLYDRLTGIQYEGIDDSFNWMTTF